MQQEDCEARNVAQGLCVGRRQACVAFPPCPIHSQSHMRIVGGVEHLPLCQERLRPIRCRCPFGFLHTLAKKPFYRRLGAHIGALLLAQGDRQIEDVDAGDAKFGLKAQEIVAEAEPHL